MEKDKPIAVVYRGPASDENCPEAVENALK